MANNETMQDTMARWGGQAPASNPSYGQVNASMGTTNYNMNPQASSQFMGMKRSTAPLAPQQQPAQPNTQKPLSYSNVQGQPGYAQWLTRENQIKTPTSQVSATNPLTDYQQSYTGIPMDQLMQQARTIFKPDPNKAQDVQRQMGEWVL